jgi:hypothetical protein
VAAELPGLVRDVHTTLATDADHGELLGLAVYLHVHITRSGSVSPPHPMIRTDDNTDCTLLVIHEAGGSWAIHGLGAPGVRLSKAEMIALAAAILGRAR